MQPVQKPITGQGNPADLSAPQQALSRFYRAFNARDMEMMGQNRAHSDDIVMDNPPGGITRGWIETQPVYARIFEGPAQVYVEYYDHTLCETGRCSARWAGNVATRDHQDLGSSLCTLGGIGRAHYFHSRHQDPDESRHVPDD
jgi:hypothetical protein